ncbi:MAG: HAD-IC family P-type ATPase, partial [Clostridia bacterium]|nr:HAD-IC family P-type ATPase [Clostridia bacterium]
LVISIPLTFFAGIGGAGNQGILVKGGNYLDALSKTKYVALDKTGTLTRGVFEVSAVYAERDISSDDLLLYAALAECASSHPIAKSLRNACKAALDRSRVSMITEHSGKGVTALVDGKIIAAGNEKLMAELGVSSRQVDEAGAVVHIAVDGNYGGCIVVSDVIKQNAANAIAALKKAGIKKTVMLTGDRAAAANAVSSALGIDEVHSGLLPEDKAERVKSLLEQKGKKERVAFVGDGINDAPVLALADVGIAMGALGSDAAIEAADVVLMDDDPEKIAKAIRIAKKTMSIVYQNILFSLLIKGACLLLGAAGIAGMPVAVFADVGVMVIAVLNALRALIVKKI